MDATIMPSITSLVKQLAADYASLVFCTSHEFSWSPHTSTVYYDPSGEYAQQKLLHELAHALLGHKGYTRDVQLLAIERDAWHYARTRLAKKYNVPISEDVAESLLDSYRDWLHMRSCCPSCELNGVQTAKNRYECLACTGAWHVNEAKACALRRYPIAR